MQRTLKEGCSGQDVLTLQRLLNFHLAGTDFSPLIPDGSFGRKTGFAVVKLQKIAKLFPDGIAGLKTRAALLNVLGTTAQVGLDVGYADAGRRSSPMPQLYRLAWQRSSIRLPPPAAGMDGAGNSGDPPAYPPASFNVQSIVFGTGKQWAWNPWALSPFVASLQANVLCKLSGGFPPFMLSPSLQYAQNTLGSPNGAWTGQGSIQFGPEKSLLSLGDFDLVNPFLALMLQQNAGQPMQGGIGIGMQPTWNLGNDKILSLFVNAQVVFAQDLHSGAGIPPAAQILAGAQADLFQMMQRAFGGK